MFFLKNCYVLRNACSSEFSYVPIASQLLYQKGKIENIKINYNKKRISKTNKISSQKIHNYLIVRKFQLD